MKVLIRHNTKHLLYSRAGTWVASRDAARDFKTTIAAVQHCSCEKLADVALLLTFDDQRMDLNLAIGDHATGNELSAHSPLGHT